MSTDFRSINASWFSLLAGEDMAIWYMAKDAEVHHQVYGTGCIINILHRINYSPLITLRFSDTIKEWPPKSFDNGKTTINISTDIALLAESAMAEFIKAEQIIENKKLEILTLKNANELECISELARRSLLTQEEREKEDKIHSDAIRDEKHKNNLTIKGKFYSGTQAPRYSRQTHCYSCKFTLSSSEEVECATCGWLLCNCGACGC